MRIAILPSGDLSYNSGSIIFAKRMLSYLSARGHDVHMIGSRAPSDMNPALMSRVTVADRLLDHPVFGDRVVTTRQYAESTAILVDYLGRLHDKEPLDLVCAHYASVNSYAAAIFCALAQRPFVVACFGRDLTLGSRDERILEMIRLSVPRAAAVIVADQDLESRLRSLLPAAERLCVCHEIPMPLDSEVLQGKRTANRGERPRVASINSCFAAEKGIDTILRAFAAVSRYLDVDLVVAGTDDHPAEVNRARLRALVSELGLTERVVFPGYLGRSEVGDLLRSATAVVDARTQGNFSSVLLEAQFLACPTIASETAAARRIIRDGVNGCLFPVGDADALAKQLTLLLSESTRRSTLRRNMELWAAGEGRRYTEEACFARYEQIMEESVQGGVDDSHRFAQRSRQT